MLGRSDSEASRRPPAACVRFGARRRRRARAGRRPGRPPLAPGARAAERPIGQAEGKDRRRVRLRVAGPSQFRIEDLCYSDRKYWRLGSQVGSHVPGTRIAVPAIIPVTGLSFFIDWFLFHFGIKPLSAVSLAAIDAQVTSRSGRAPSEQQCAPHTDNRALMDGGSGTVSLRGWARSVCVDLTSGKLLFALQVAEIHYITTWTEKKSGEPPSSRGRRDPRIWCRTRIGSSRAAARRWIGFHI